MNRYTAKTLNDVLALASEKVKELTNGKLEDAFLIT